MKSSFPEHFPPSKQTVSKLWKSATFAIDANVLLNLYRYSKDTRSEVLQVFKLLSDRLFIPHQAAFEFLNCRVSVIGDQIKAYKEATTSLRNIAEAFENSRRHPFIAESLFAKLRSLSEEVNSSLANGEREFTELLTQDSIREEIADTLEGKIGSPFDDAQLKEIYKAGEVRFDNATPPGYKDNKKPHPAKFGDLVVWFQLLKKIETDKADIIFITDDQKEDWWATFGGRTLGPRHELIAEALAHGGRFHMYTVDRFIELAGKLLKRPATEKTLKEVKEVRKQSVSDNIEAKTAPNVLNETLYQYPATMPHVNFDFIGKAQEKAYVNGLADAIAKLQFPKADQGALDALAKIQIPQLDPKYLDAIKMFQFPKPDQGILDALAKLKIPQLDPMYFNPIGKMPSYMFQQEISPAQPPMPPKKEESAGDSEGSTSEHPSE